MQVFWGLVCCPSFEGTRGLSCIFFLVPPAGFEPATHELGTRRSIHSELRGRAGNLAISRLGVFGKPWQSVQAFGRFRALHAAKAQGSTTGCDSVLLLCGSILRAKSTEKE